MLFPPPSPSGASDEGSLEFLAGAQRVCAWVQSLAALGGFAISLLTMAIWLGGPMRPVAAWPGVMLMRMNAATAIACATLALILWQVSRTRPKAAPWAVALAVITSVIGGLTSLEILFHLDFGIDQLLASGVMPEDRAAAYCSAPGQMSLNASASLFFLGLALAGLDWRISFGRLRHLYCAPILALLGSLPAACAVVGYILNTSGFTGLLRSTNVLFHTALTLLVLACGVLAARPQYPPVSRLFSTGTDGVLLRWLLPGSTLLLVALGWGITKVREAGLLVPGEGTALMLYGGLILLSLLMFAASGAVARQEASARQADTALHEEEKRSRTILEASLDAVLLMDAEGCVVDWNPAAERMFGWTKEELLGQPVPEYIIPASVRAAHTQELARFAETGQWHSGAQRLEQTARRRQGEEFPVELSINAVAGVGRPLWVGFLRDITVRKGVERALRESEQRFRALADNMSQLAWMTDETGGIVWFNRRWFNFTGTTLADVQGWAWQQVAHPEHVQRVVKKMRDCFEHGWPWEDLFPLRDAEGGYRWFLSRAMPICNEAGQVQHWFGTNTDVTEQRALAEELARSKETAEAASRAKDDFLAALSHELRTPLTPALLSAAALRHDERLPLELRPEIAMIERSISLESRLIDDLLDLTRITRGKLPLRTEPCDVHSLIGHALEIVRDDAQGKQVELDVELGAPFSGLVGDPARLQQVFWNLLRNAVKFTPMGGRITVRTHNSPDDQRFILEISDTGIGFAPEAGERLFLPFEQGNGDSSHRFGGLGLGLSIARAIVDLHGGTIRARSLGLDRGATFTVELPGATAPPAGMAPQGAEGTGRAASQSLRILLVEDHGPTLAVLSKLLAREGHQVVTANSMARGLEAIQTETFDVLISDLGLPDGSGFQLMSAIRASHPSLPGIALSGYGMEQDLRRSLEAGFHQHLVKPVDFGQLRHALNGLFPSGVLTEV